MCRTLVVSALALLLSICPEVMADHIILKNGDRLTGSIAKLDGQKLIIKTDYAGEITITSDVIAQVESDRPLHIGLSDGQTIVGTVTTVADKLEVQTKDAGKVTVARAAIKTIRSQSEQNAYDAEIERYRNPGLLDLWSGFLQAGLSLTRGNSDTTNLALGANAVRATSRDKTSAYFTSLYATNKTSGSSLTTANAVRGGVRYELNLSDRAFAFGFGDAEFDEFQMLDLRLVLGGGLGYYVKKAERTQFQIFGGGSLNKEYFSDNTKRTSGEVLVGEDLTTRLSDRVAFSQRFVLFPNLSEGGEFRATFDSALVTKLNTWLDWHITLSDRYLSDPVAAAKKNDVLLTTGVRLSFKR
jgi:putative salt-induced outer membrane protein YdiY